MSVPTPSEMFSKVTIKRYGVGSWVNGVYSQGTELLIDIIASVQPMRPNELLNLPEAQRTRAAVKVYSEVELRTANDSTKTQADRVVWQGDDYEVQMVDRHVLSNLAHYKAIATRLERS